ncbi:MAG: hypothetical protein OER86_13240 [Phycisphaerae bacterium]|nr:hypothetical protein [Phycisphaerae bacterium]
MNIRTTGALLAASLAALIAPVHGKPPPLNRTHAPGSYQKPAQTAAAMAVPDGFSVQAFAGEPDVVQPIAFCIDPRGRLWVVENYSYPNWKAEGRDRILILEDTDGDGRFDKRKVFWDKGNFVSGIQVGFGGVWVGTPPHLLFIPDRDGDDKPDGKAVPLLDGWGHQDTHETLNSFVWGPDGWLYGCQGVFTRSRVGKPGTPDDQRVPLNAGIWRYHPTKHVFEAFARGGSNQWGVDFNDRGQAFMTACVIPHLFHVVQGGRYRRQSGRHLNPHTYDDIKTIRTHSHYAAAYSGALIYLGDNFPGHYRDQLFFNNIHASKVHLDLLERKGSGYQGRLGPHDVDVKIGRSLAPHEQRGTGFIDSADKWYRGLCLRTGPDGGVFINDWYDQRPCHQLRPHDQDIEGYTGRIYKVTHGKPKPLTGVNVAAMDNAVLVQLQLHRNDWWVRTARRVLQERAAAGSDLSAARAALSGMAGRGADVTRRLRAIWALHVTGGIDPQLMKKLLVDSDPYVRAWAIQCELEDRKVAEPIHARLVELAKQDPSPVVRLYLASACQRMADSEAWPIVEALVRHEKDAADHNLPAMYWYALEPLVAADKSRALRLMATTKISKLREWIARRAAAR